MAASANVSAPSPEEVERASELARNGGQLFTDGAYPAAIEAYEAAWRLVEDPNLLYNIALCHEKAGDLDLAADSLDRYRALAPAGERDELARRAVALRDQAERDRNDALAAEAAAERAREEERLAAEREAARLESEREAAETAEAAEAERAHERAERKRKRVVIASSIGAVGGVAAVTGTALGVVALGQSREAGTLCVGDLCPTAAEPLLARARGTALGADVSFAVAGASTIGLIVYLIATHEGDEPKQARVRVTGGPTAAGLGFGGRF
jgi:tetratricopeptide (TPR) repeat protein